MLPPLALLATNTLINLNFYNNHPHQNFIPDDNDACEMQLPLIAFDVFLLTH
ncbi:hypothetical protein GA0061070_104130 [Kosakonia oryziphila]|uniref:Uncharacterized protein n=1 Tax=Kosakonia oryziphila TaxID=1005667 RepID=A0A1C4FSC0_9ENTR|nr:hypothetical protein GA0061070_104130 [Kosakonia oryziphila]